MAGAGVFDTKSIVSADTDALIKWLIIAGKSFKAPLRKAGLQMASSMEMNFVQGGRPKKWAGLKLDTILKRGSVPGGEGLPKVLRDKGILSGSIGNPVRDPKGLFELDDYEVQTGTVVSYGKWHQEGTKHLVARPFVMAQPQDTEAIERFLTEYVMEQKK